MISDITHVTVRKMGESLETETGDIMGEKCMRAESGEHATEVNDVSG